MKRITILTIILTCGLMADKYISVDLGEQMAYAYDNDELVMSGRISSGVPQHPTPEGDYTILEKKQRHVSNIWPKPKGGAKMNYMLRLSYSGIAMHLGVVPDYPASHGCIRMQNGFAQKLWKWAKVGTRVEVYGFAPERDTYSERSRRDRNDNGYARNTGHERERRSAFYDDYIIED